MSKSRDKVLKIMRESFSNQWVTTQEIADNLNLSREVISLYLSQLKKKQLIKRKNGRPVLWKAKENLDDVDFDEFVGNNGSQREIIKKCKAAVNYPPNGLPMIITGPSGTGKSLLARLIFNYAKSKGVIDDSSQFVTLNCADYANNPELLSSVLFGYTKGAFTGASTEKEGLLDKANNGFLFLDEVHRLTGENQEKLFTLLDKGVFYPVGSDSTPHFIKTRFIFATTEPLDNFLLQTLQRRVPMTISLPSLSDRPLWERYQLLIKYFSFESETMNSDIYITTKLLKQLLYKKLPGNIGELKNDIKILCAENYQGDDKSDILIGSVSSNENYILIGQKENDLVPQLNLLKNLFQDNFGIFESSFSKFESIDIIQKKVLNYIIDNKKSWNSWIKKDPLYIVGKNNALKTFKYLENNYGLIFSDSQEMQNNIAFIHEIINYIDIPDNSRLAFNLHEYLSIHYPRTSYVIEKSISSFESSMQDTKLTVLKNLITVIIGGNIYRKLESIPYTCLLVAHGTGTATSIRNTVNSLCNNFIFEAFDMPIDSSIDEINLKVQHYLKKVKQNTNNGVILFFDMGSLQEMFSKINQQIGSNLLVINNLTTSTVLDVALSVEQNKAFEKIAEHADSYGDYLKVQYHEGLSQANNIVISCMSGVGVSQEIKNILDNESNNNIEIITMEYAKLKNLLKYKKKDYFKNTKFIITTVDFPGNSSVPIINIYGILDGDGTRAFKRLLIHSHFTQNNITDIMSHLVKFFSIAGVKNRLHILNPDVVIDDVESIVKDYEAYYGINLSEKIKLNLYMHIALMLERTVLSHDKEDIHSSENRYTDAEKKFMQISKHIFTPIDIKYNLTVSNDEIMLIYEILMSEIVPEN